MRFSRCCCLESGPTRDWFMCSPRQLATPIVPILCTEAGTRRGPRASPDEVGRELTSASVSSVDATKTEVGVAAIRRRFWTGVSVAGYDHNHDWTRSSVARGL